MCSLRGYPNKAALKGDNDFFGWFLTREQDQVVAKSMRFVFDSDESKIVYYTDAETGNIRSMKKAKIKAWKKIDPPLIPPTFVMEELCKKNAQIVQ